MSAPFPIEGAAAGPGKRIIRPPHPIDVASRQPRAPWNAVGVSNPLQNGGHRRPVTDLGATLRQAREAAGLSLAGMAERTGYSRSYLGNAETGLRNVTPGLIRAYERVLGEDLKRRTLLVGAVSTFVLPDVAVDIARDVSVERSRLLATVQTSHEVDIMPKGDPLDDILTTYEQPFEMTGTGEIVDGKVHIHAVMGGEDGTVAGHLHWAKVQDWFARAYVIPA
jgi:transcriptional regulator with XRE-family HTH domain